MTESDDDDDVSPRLNVPFGNRPEELVTEAVARGNTASGERPRRLLTYDQTPKNEISVEATAVMQQRPTSSKKALRSSLRNVNRNGRHRSPAGRKTVSFSSKASSKVSNVTDCYNLMQQGCEFIKLRGTSRQFRRFFSLDADLSHIRWTPTNKKPHKARIAVEDIKEVRLGKNADLIRTSETLLNDLQEECVFSIIYGENFESLDLVAATAEDANVWATGLLALTSNKHDCRPSSSSWATIRERWLGSVFEEADADKRGFVGEATAVKLIRQINPRLSLNRVLSKVKEAANSQEEADRGKIGRQEFVELFKEVSTRPEVYFLMVRYANKDYLSCHDLQLFLETEQGMTGVTSEYCETLIEQYEPAPEAKNIGFMTVDGFTNYLMSQDCLLFDPNHSNVWMDMKQSFSRYFIAASHKTYLVEDQLGPASPDGYASALKRNCRLVEMDLYDPQEKHKETEPMVRNGTVGGKTTRIPLSQALRAIRETAFERSRYPLILSMSVHCSSDWQKVAATLLTTHLGNKLYIPVNDPTDWSKTTASPADFIQKILIMGRKIAAGSDSGEVTEDEEINVGGITPRKKGKTIKLVKELSDLVPSFLAVKQLNDLLSTAPNSNSMNPRHHVPLLSEATCLRLMHNYAAEFAQTTRDYTTKVSPNVSRRDSSNLNPQEFWNHGVQMVSLNYQTPGLMMDLQEGRFSENGACGYVLKPEVMKDSLFCPGEKIPVAPQILHLKILSGQQLPRPRGSTAKGDSADPFVVVEIFGLPVDCAEERTKTIRNDSNNPCFDESFQFQVTVPEIALVRFLVLDDDFIGDDFIGQYTIPFDCLQPGYRHISLLNSEGDPLESATLFVHIAITNRRGGGKARKRGMSVKRRNSRVNTGMKQVGIRSIDELFKMAVAPLAESIAMRSKLEAAMVEWQEECGLGPAGTIRQGLRLVHSRMITLSSNSSPPGSPSSNDHSHEAPSFYVDSDDHNYPVINTCGVIPEQLQRSFNKLKVLIGHSVATLQQADNLLAKIEESIQRISNSHEELGLLCVEGGLKGQKATRAAENFTWNLRLLKAQLNLMSKSQDEAQDIITQVFDTAGVLGILSERLRNRRRRFSRVVPDPHDAIL